MTNSEFAASLATLLDLSGADTTALAAMLDLWALGGATVPRLSRVIGDQNERADQLTARFAEWQAGTATGGPNSNGLYPLRASDGTEYLVPSPAKIASIDATITPRGSVANAAALNALTGTSAGDLYTVADPAPAQAWVRNDANNGWVNMGSFAGPVGIQGPSGTIVSATAETLPVNSSATVTLGGTPEARTMHFGLPAAVSPDTVEAFTNLGPVVARADDYGIATSAAVLGFALSGQERAFKEVLYRDGPVLASTFPSLPGDSFSRASSGTARAANGSLLSFATGVPRIVPAVGILVERSSANLITNSLLHGGVSGSPGTLPRNAIAITPTGAPVFTYTEDSQSAGGYRMRIQAVVGNRGGPRFSVTFAPNTSYVFSVVADIVQSTNFRHLVEWLTVPAGSTIERFIDGAPALIFDVPATGRRVLSVVLTTGGVVSSTGTIAFGVGTTGALIDPVDITYDLPQIEIGTVRTSYIPTAPAATNLLLNSDVVQSQNITVTAVQQSLSFTGTGTVTLSGASTAGPLAGTGANDRVSLTFTPTAGVLSLTVSGSVTLGQLETGGPTPYIPTTTAAVTRPALNPNRAADIAQAGFAPSNAGTMVVEFVQPPAHTDPKILLGGTVSADAPIYIEAGQVRSFRDIGAAMLSTGSTAAPGTVRRAAVTWEPGRRALAATGAAVVSDAAAFDAVTPISATIAGMSDVISPENLTRFLGVPPRPNLDGGSFANGSYTANTILAAQAYWKQHLPWVPGRIYEVSAEVHTLQAGTDGSLPRAEVFGRRYNGGFASLGDFTTSRLPVPLGQSLVLTQRMGMGVTPAGGVQIASGTDISWVTLGLIFNRTVSGAALPGAQSRLDKISIRDVTGIAATGIGIGHRQMLGQPNTSIRLVAHLPYAVSDAELSAMTVTP